MNKLGIFEIHIFLAWFISIKCKPLLNSMKKLLFSFFTLFTFSSAYPQAHLTWIKSGSDKSVPTNQSVNFSIATDKSGNIYTAGAFQGTLDFDPGTKEYNLTSVNNADMFIQKYDKDGHLVWVKTFPFTSWPYGWPNIAADSKGNLYVTGAFEDTVDFDPGAGVYNLISPKIPSLTFHDIYLLKLDTDGNFVWARNYNQLVQEHETFIKTDGLDNVYLSAAFDGKVDLDPSEDSLIIKGEDPFYHSENSLKFLQKLDPAGNLVRGMSLGIYMKDLEVDAAGNFYMITDSSSHRDIKKYDNNWKLAWKEHSVYNYVPKFISVDMGQNVYLGGDFCCEPVANNNDPDAGNYVQKRDLNGQILWTRNTFSYYGYTSSEAMEADNDGNVYLTGFFNHSVDFNTSTDTLLLTSNSKHGDLFVQKHSTDGKFEYAEMVKNFYSNIWTAHDQSGNFFVSGGRGDRGDWYDASTRAAPGLTPFVMKWGAASTVTATVADNYAAMQVGMFPNPTTGRVYFLLNSPMDNARIEILDGSGKTVQTETLNAGSNFIDIEGPAGLYTVSIITQETKVCRKVIKQ